MQAPSAANVPNSGALALHGDAVHGRSGVQAASGKARAVGGLGESSSAAAVPDRQGLGESSSGPSSTTTSPSISISQSTLEAAVRILVQQQQSLDGEDGSALRSADLNEEEEGLLLLQGYEQRDAEVSVATVVYPTFEGSRH